jgi:phosphatidylglycerol:prolipoprotein diacylglycerol transferase
MLLNKSDIDKKTRFTPRMLSLVLAGLGFFLATVLYYPVSLVFSGEWKVNQKVDLARQVTIDFNRLGIAEIVKSMRIETVLPIGSISIRFYAISLLIGILLGYFLILFLSKRHYIAGTIIDRLVIGLIVFGLIGARLFFVIFNWSFYVESPVIIVTEILSGGLAFFGMLIFGLTYIWIYTARFKFSLFEFLDFMAPGVLLGQVIGRWGNFFNYEAYGPETSVFWKMAVPDTANYYGNLNATYFHPTFLYEIIPNFIALIIILYFYESLTSKRSGLVFSLYAIFYGTIRFFVEFYRMDALKINLPNFLQVSLGYFGSLEYIRVSQVAALFLLLIGIYLFIKRAKVIYFKKDMTEFNTY